MTIDLNSSDYVVKNAVLECDKGSTVAFFNPTNAVGAETGTGKQGIQTDGRADNIAGNFGTCSGNQNKPCEKAVSGKWYNTSRSSYYSTPYHQALEDGLHKLINDISANPIFKDALTSATSETPPPIFSNNDAQLHLCSKEQYNYLQRRINEINKLENALRSIQVDNQNDKKLKNQLIFMTQAQKFFAKTLSFSPSRSFSTIQIPYLIIDSKLPCPKYMGVISVFRGREGQVLEIESHDDPLADLKERVKEVIRKHYGVGTPEASADENAPQTAEEEIIAKLTESLDGRDDPAADAQTIMTGLNAEKSKRQLEAELTVAQEAGRTSDVTRLDQEINELGTAITAKNEIMDNLDNTEASLQVKLLVHSAKTAEITIEELEIDDEEDALKLLAWLVLLNENGRWTNQDAEPVFSMDNAIAETNTDVRNNEYGDYGIYFADSVPEGREAVFEYSVAKLREKIADCEVAAFNLPREHPCPDLSYYPSSYAGHKGKDYTASVNTPTYATTAGYVINAVNDRPSGTMNDDLTTEQCAGNYVRIRDAEGNDHWYAHHNAGSVVVSAEEYLLPGRQLGGVGNSGYTSGGLNAGYHLHYEVQRNRGFYYDNTFYDDLSPFLP